MMELERAKYILTVEENRKIQLEEAAKVVAEAEPSDKPVDLRNDEASEETVE